MLKFLVGLLLEPIQRLCEQKTVDEKLGWKDLFEKSSTASRWHEKDLDFTQDEAKSAEKAKVSLRFLSVRSFIFLHDIKAYHIEHARNSFLGGLWRRFRWPMMLFIYRVLYRFGCSDRNKRFTAPLIVSTVNFQFGMLCKNCKRSNETLANAFGNQSNQEYCMNETIIYIDCESAILVGSSRYWLLCMQSCYECYFGVLVWDFQKLQSTLQRMILQGKAQSYAATTGCNELATTTGVVKIVPFWHPLGSDSGSCPNFFFTAGFSFTGVARAAAAAETTTNDAQWQQSQESDNGANYGTDFDVTAFRGVSTTHLFVQVFTETPIAILSRKSPP